MSHIKINKVNDYSILVSPQDNQSPVLLTELVLVPKKSHFRKYYCLTYSI